MPKRSHGMRLAALAGGFCLAVFPVAYADLGAEPLPDPMDYGPEAQQFAFDAADQDGDGVVSEAEFVRDAAAAFSSLDTNRDGLLSPDELGPHDPDDFARIDTNGDGFLSFPEVMTYKIKAFRDADKDTDDALSYDEMLDSVKAEEGVN